MKLRTRLIVALAATGALAATLTGCQQTPVDCSSAPTSQQVTAAPAGFSSPSRGGGFGFRTPSFKAPSAPKPQRMNPAPKPAPKPAAPKATTPKVTPKKQTVPAPQPQRAPEVHNHYNTGGSGFNGFLGGMGLGWLIGQSGDNGQAVCS